MSATSHRASTSLRWRKHHLARVGIGKVVSSCHPRLRDGGPAAEFRTLFVIANIIPNTGNRVKLVFVGQWEMLSDPILRNASIYEKRSALGDSKNAAASVIDVTVTYG